MDGRKKKGQKTRQAILDAAEIILRDKKTSTLSTRAIARRAGISQSSLYHHFAGLEEIVLACFKEKAEQILRTDHVRQFDEIQDYLHYLLEISVNSLQLMHNVVYSAKNLISEKANQDKEFRRKLLQMGQELISNLKINLREIAGSGANEHHLDLIVFAFTMFREGFVSYSQLYDESLFDNTSELILQVLKHFSDYIEPVELKNVV